MKTMGQRNLKLLGGQTVFSQGPRDLDLWTSDLKINKGHHDKPDSSIPLPPYNFVVRGYKNIFLKSLIEIPI
jgi:hypothetical protein